MGAGGTMMFITSPAWIPTVGTVIFIGGAALTVYDFFDSFYQGVEMGEELGKDLEELLKKRFEQTPEGKMCPI